jgi:hypothetical protein
MIISEVLGIVLCTFFVSEFNENYYFEIINARIYCSCARLQVCNNQL